MTAAAILFALARAGVTVTLAGENLRIVPASMLTVQHRALIADNKPAVVALLVNAHHTAQELVSSINRCCDARGDADHNRADLLTECRLLTPYEQADMREHFDAEAERWTIGDSTGSVLGSDRRNAQAQTIGPWYPASRLGTGLS